MCNKKMKKIFVPSLIKMKFCSKKPAKKRKKMKKMKISTSKTCKKPPDAKKSFNFF